MNTKRHIGAILGDYNAFFQDLRQRIADAGIDIDGCTVSHMAFRTATFDAYVHVRDELRLLCSREVENAWNGRLIGKLLLDEPLLLDSDYSVSLIELIPPPHQREYPMALEHVGFVIGESFETFKVRYESVLTGQQDQGPYCQPVYITFENNRTVKFYRHSLKDVVEMEGRAF